MVGDFNYQITTVVWGNTISYSSDMKTKITVPDELEIIPTQPTELLVISDIHLSAHSTKASRNVERVIGDRIKALSKLSSAIVVLNGDIFELWAGQKPSVNKALQGHPKLTKNLQEFSKGANHQVVMVVGNHDGKLGWSETEQQVLIKNFNAQICFSLSIKLSNKANAKRILFEHGHMLDSENAFEDPRDPHDKPFGQYIVQRALPMVQSTQGSLLTGLNHIAEPHKFAKFVASRLMYREVFNRLWWLIIPLAVTFALRVIIGYDVFTFTGFSYSEVQRIVLYTELAVVVNVGVILFAIVIIVQRVLSRAKTVPGTGAGEGHNYEARKKASNLIDQGKTIGFITGHTHKPAIVEIKDGFFANSGCGVEMIYASQAHFGLPNTYISLNQLSWLEISLTKNAGSVVLWQMSEDNHKLTKLERMVTKKSQFGKALHKSHEHNFKY